MRSSWRAEWVVLIGCSPPAPQPVQRARAGDPQNPATRRGPLPVVPVGLHPGLQKNLLQDLLGLAPPAEEAHEQTEDHRSVKVEHLGQSLTLSGGHPAYEIGLPGQIYRCRVRDAQKLSQYATLSAGPGYLWTALTSQAPARSSQS